MARKREHRIVREALRECSASGEPVPSWYRCAREIIEERINVPKGYLPERYDRQLRISTKRMASARVNANFKKHARR